MENFVAHYSWWLLALILIGAEVIAPGYFLLWIGIAAGIMGLLTFVLPALGVVTQAILFAALALAVCVVYWKWIRPRAEVRNDQPLLNRRGQRMVGRRVIVVDAIVNGRGKVAVGDGRWLAEGPDAAVGTEVEVVSVNGTTLSVRLPGEPDAPRAPSES